MKQASLFDKSPSGAHVIVEKIEWIKYIQKHHGGEIGTCWPAQRRRQSCKVSR